MDNLDEMEDMVMDETREASFEPHEGMEFPSQDATFDFYNAYGYIIGFSIRTQTKYKNVEGLITSIRLVCSKEGFTKKRKHQLEESLEMDNELVEETPEKEISTKRYGCKASCQIRLHKDGIWRITGLFKDHNHQLVPNTPSKRRHLRYHKRISMEDRVDIELLHEQNVGATQIREYLVAKARGKENLHFSKKDVNNHIASAKKIMNKALTARVAYDKTCRTLDVLD